MNTGLVRWFACSECRGGTGKMPLVEGMMRGGSSVYRMLMGACITILLSGCKTTQVEVRGRDEGRGPSLPYEARNRRESQVHERGGKRSRPRQVSVRRSFQFLRHSHRVALAARLQRGEVRPEDADVQFDAVMAQIATEERRRNAEAAALQAQQSAAFLLPSAPWHRHAASSVGGALPTTAAERYSHPRSPNAERSTPGGAYHPAEP